MKDTKRRAAALLCAAALILNLPAYALASENAAELPEQELIVAQTEPEAAGAEAPEASEEAPEASEEAPEVSEEAPEVSEEAPEASEEAPEVSKEAPEASEEAPEEEGVAPAEDNGIKNVQELNQAIKAAADGATIRVNTPELDGGEDFIDIRNKKNLTLELGTTKLRYVPTSGARYALRITGGSGITVRGGQLSGGGVYVRDSAQNVLLQDISVNNAYEHGVYVTNNAKQVAVRKLTIANAESIGIYVAKANLSCIEDCAISGGGKTVKAIELNNASSVSGSIVRNRISDITDKGILVTNRKENDQYVANSGSWVAGDIANNVLTGVRGDGIGIYHGSHCKSITGNQLTNIGGAHNGVDGDYGIIIDSMINEGTYAESITNNTISNVTYAGIVIYSGPNGDHASSVLQDTAFVSGNISGNRLTNVGCYPHSPGWTKEKKKGCLSGIYVDTHACVKGDITGNTVDTVGEHGIYIHLKSWVKNISGNTVKNARQDGIEVYTATVKGGITGNTITNSGEHGISALNAGLIQGKVEKNTVTGAGMCGIYLDKSQAKSALNKNKLTKVKKHGINLSGGSFAAKATNNTIAVLDAANSYGIRVTGKSKLPGITGNKVSGKMKNGIRIDQLLAKTTISKNTLSVSGKKSFLPMNLTGAPKLALIVTNNTITGNLTHYGITLTKGIATIKGNTIKKCTCPINVVSNKFAVTVQGNKLSQNKENKVRVAGKKVDTAKLKKPQKLGKVTISA